jgi:hypothetical protein
MAEKQKAPYQGWSLERIEQELLEAQQEHDKVVAESSERIAKLMAARDAKVNDEDDNSAED